MKARSARDSAFTLVELLVAIAIVGMLATLLVPTVKGAMEKGRSAKCAGNLRTISGAVQTYAADNDSRFPMIESMPSNPVYSGDEEAGTLLEVLGPYGLGEAALRCPADLARENYFAREGASYMWRPLVDDELTTAPKIYHPRRGEIVPPLSRLALAADFTRVHGRRINCVFADGHVRMF